VTREGTFAEELSQSSVCALALRTEIVSSPRMAKVDTSRKKTFQERRMDFLLFCVNRFVEIVLVIEGISL
jgi:hypothetical protein